MNNLIDLLLALKFHSPAEFVPDEQFFSQTKISRERYQELKEGATVSGREYRAIREFLGITKEEAAETRQLKLFK